MEGNPKKVLFFTARSGITVKVSERGMGERPDEVVAGHLVVRGRPTGVVLLTRTVYGCHTGKVDRLTMMGWTKKK